MKRRARRLAVEGAILAGGAFYLGAMWAIEALDTLGMLRDPRS